MNLDRVVQLMAEGPMPLIRTDFSSDAAWQSVIDQVSRASDLVGDGEGYEPNIEPIDDPGFDAATAEVLANVWPREHHGYVILADQRSMREVADNSDATVVLVDLSASEEDAEEFGWIFGRAFRSVASEIAGIEANLSIANMDFSEFADSVDGDGVFRGF